MTDEPEEVEYDDEETPEETEICAGTLVIHDVAKWRSKDGMNAIATQVTEEGGVYVIDAETHKLRMVELDDGKAKAKLARIQ